MRHSPFHRLWAAAAFANLGDGATMVAVPLLAATLTRDPALVGALTGTLFLPHLLLGVPAGALVDRVARRTAMLAANAVRVLALAGLCAGLASGTVGIAWLFALVFVLGATESVHDAAADGAVRQLVGPDRLDGANARLQGTITVTGNFLGVPLGALLFTVGAVAPFGAHAVLLVAASLLVATLTPLAVRAATTAAPQAVPDGAGGAGVTEGMRWLRRHRGLRTLLGVSAGMAFAGQLAQSTLVLFVVDVLGLRAEWFGAFGVAVAVGAVAGAVLAPRLGRRLGRVRAMLAVATLEVLGLSAVGLAPSVAVALGGMLVVAAAIGCWNVLSMSLRQALVPPHLFGRVHGAWRAAVWGALPVGAWLGGVVGSVAGLRAPWLVGAGLYALVLVAGVLGLGRAGMLTRPVVLTR